MKRKRYTEDLEFRISEDDDSGDDSSAPKSPSSSSQLQARPGGLHTPFRSADMSFALVGDKLVFALSIEPCFQDVHEAEGPVVEKIMGIRSTKKQVRCACASLPVSVVNW